MDLDKNSMADSASNYDSDSDTDFETEVPKFSAVHVDSGLDAMVRNKQRLRYIEKVLGNNVLSTFDPNVIRCACDGFYTGSRHLYSSDLKRLAQALVDRGAVLTWLGRGSRIATVMRNIKHQDQ